MASLDEQPVPRTAWSPSLATAERPGVTAACEQLLAAARAAVAASPDCPPEAAGDDSFVAQVAARELLAAARLTPGDILAAVTQVAVNGVIACAAEQSSEEGAIVNPARVAAAAKGLGVAISWGLSATLEGGLNVAGARH